MADNFNETLGIGSYGNDAAAAGWYVCDDDQASTVVVDHFGQSNGTLSGAASTSFIQTSGPTSWLPKAFSFAGSEHVDTGLTPPTGSAARSIGCRFKAAAIGAGERKVFGYGNGGTNGGAFTASIETVSSSPYVLLRHGGGNIRYPLTTSVVGVWRSVVLVVPDGASTTDDVICYVDGLAVEGVRNGGADRALATVSAALYFGDANDVFGGHFIGAVADVIVYNRALTAAEVLQWQNGPEPVVSSGADTIDGTPQVGSTLSIDAEAVYGLAAPFVGLANGSTSYAYQWTRSNDNSGTGETSIAGAAGTTYELAAADVGKYVRRQRTPSNSGGTDAAEIINSTMSAIVEAVAAAVVVDTNPVIRGGSRAPKIRGASTQAATLRGVRQNVSIRGKGS